MGYFYEAIEVLQELIWVLSGKQMILYRTAKYSHRPITKRTMQKHLIHHLFVPP